MRLWSIRNRTLLNNQLSNFLTILFFLFLIDALLSYWIPNFIQNIYHNSFYMGLIVSSSSIVGLVFDMVFSEVLTGRTVGQVTGLLGGGIFFFIFFLGLSSFKASLIFILLAMASWGFYYDLFNFASQQYVAESTPLPDRPLVWSIVGFIRNLAYFIGPIIVVKLLFNNPQAILGLSLVLLLLASLKLKLSAFKRQKSTFQHRAVSFLAELSHWRVLFDHVWPLLIISLFLGLIDATYWTTGTIITNNLARTSIWGSLFLSLYVLPFLLSGSFIYKFHLKTVRYHLVLTLLFLAGAFLASINLLPYLWWKLIIVFVSSTLIAISQPLINTAYTNLLIRLGRHREHLIGLSDSMLNLAYVIGPIIAGGLAAWVGNINTFVIMGIGLGLTTILLWLTMPNKLRLPQKEISQWEE